MGVPGHDRRHSGVEIFPGQLNALGGPAAPGGSRRLLIDNASDAVPDGTSVHPWHVPAELCRLRQDPGSTADTSALNGSM